MSRAYKLNIILRGIWLNAKCSKDNTNIDKLVEYANRRIQTVYKGKRGWWCPAFERCNLFKCSMKSITEHKIIPAKCKNKDCNKKCFVIFEESEVSNERRKRRID